MLTSKGLILLRAGSKYQQLQKLQKLQKAGIKLHAPLMSGGSWSYRCVPQASKSEVVVSHILGGILWWWMAWNLWHDHKHITGEWYYPEPSEWTDEELGIPP